MRPSHPVFEQSEPQPRKSSHADHSPSDRLSAAPSTFFLSRSSDKSPEPSEPREIPAAFNDPVASLHDYLQESRASKHPTPRILDGQRSTSRRRSTIKPGLFERPRRTSSTSVSSHAEEAIQRSTTPSPLPSTAASLPESPKSISSRSVPKSDEELNSDDASSQAVASSEEDGDAADAPAPIQDSQPELIMPSIKMPSRRPFTERGKQLGRFKILVAGQKGWYRPLSWYSC
jgi:hypothetical protein